VSEARLRAYVESGAEMVKYLEEHSRVRFQVVPGYSDYYRDSPVQLTRLLSANQISIEHRFFAESRPNPVDWSKLTIQQMAADLNLPTEIVGRPIVREPDGLAMSSRNTYLNPEERVSALCLYRALLAARELVASGAKSRENILEAVRQIINSTPHTRIDYVALVDPATLQEVEAIQGEARLLLAVWVNKTRLIDNTLLSESRLCCV
jgi:hypothetical protein